jgi:hypothetical protein
MRLLSPFAPTALSRKGERSAGFEMLSKILIAVHPHGRFNVDSGRPPLDYQGAWI